jgi:thiol-disulfide isomerase/thioredoxin
MGGAGLLAGCAAGGAGGAPAEPSSEPVNPDVAIASAAARAQLDACPPSDARVPAHPDGLPDVTLPCLGAEGPARVRLAGLRGRPVVLNIWAQWCPPCRAEAPLLQRLHAAAGERLIVLGVDYQDDAVPALAFAQAHQLHYPSVSAPADEFPLRRYGPGPPVTLLVEPSGRVARVVRGPFDSWAELSSIVADVLGVQVGGQR